eukprot:IDg21889t1
MLAQHQKRLVPDPVPLEVVFVVVVYSATLLDGQRYRHGKNVAFVDTSRVGRPNLPQRSKNFCTSVERSAKCDLQLFTERLPYLPSATTCAAEAPSRQSGETSSPRIPCTC